MGLFVSVAIALAAGLCVGVLAGMLGIGGGVLMVPLFRLGFCLDAVMATATSLFCILPTACAGAISHIRNNTCLPRVGVAMGIGGALLSPVGVWLANRSPSIVIMVAMAAIIVYSSTTMIRKALSADSEKGTRSDVLSQDVEDFETFNLKVVLECAGVGAIAGFCSGFVGVGGGFIMVPMMIALFGIPMSKTSGTSLIAIGIIAIPGIIAQAVMGNIDFCLGIAVAAGSIPGAYLGARLVKRISEKYLRLSFAVVLIIAAIILVINELGFLE